MLTLIRRMSLSIILASKFAIASPLLPISSFSLSDSEWWCVPSRKWKSGREKREGPTVASAIQVNVTCDSAGAFDTECLQQITVSKLLKLWLWHFVCRMWGLTWAAESTFSELLKLFSNSLKLKKCFLCCETHCFTDAACPRTFCWAPERHGGTQMISVHKLLCHSWLKTETCTSENYDCVVTPTPEVCHRSQSKQANGVHRKAVCVTTNQPTHVSFECKPLVAPIPTMT